MATRTHFIAFIFLTLTMVSSSNCIPFSNPFTKYPSPVPSAQLFDMKSSPSPVSVTDSEAEKDQTDEQPTETPFAIQGSQEPQHMDESDDAEDDSDDEAEPLVTATPTSPTSSRAVCVDAKYLEGKNVEAATLVHTSHILSEVLCPMNSTLPCATHNHALIFNGMLTSYRQFCGQPGNQCRVDVKFVNSVLVGLWQNEDHPHVHSTVQLTMFDFRYPRVLQHILHDFISIRRSLAMKIRST